MTYFGIPNFVEFARANRGTIVHVVDSDFAFAYGSTTILGKDIPLKIMSEVNGDRDPLPLSLFQWLSKDFPELDNYDPWATLTKLHQSGTRFEVSKDKMYLSYKGIKLVYLHAFTPFIRRFEQIGKTSCSVDFFTVMVLGVTNIKHPNDPWIDLMVERNKSGKMYIDHQHWLRPEIGDIFCTWWPIVDRILLKHYNDRTVPPNCVTKWQSFSDIAARFTELYGTPELVELLRVC